MVLYMSSKHGSAGNYTTWVTEYMQVSMLVNTGTCIMFSHTHQTFGLVTWRHLSRHFGKRNRCGSLVANPDPHRCGTVERCSLAPDVSLMLDVLQFKLQSNVWQTWK